VVDDKPFQPTVIYGQVVDPQTGKPVSPIWIRAASDALPSPFPPLVAECGTQQDGQYWMEIPNVTEPVDIAVFAGYQRKMSMQDYLSQSAPVKTVRLGPGESAEVDIQIPGSVTADLRIITEDGKPVPGVRPLERGDQIGESDAFGQIRLFCLEPRVVHEFVFEKITDEGFLRGQSPPLSGEPGSHLPQQDVILYAVPIGSAFGQIALPAGISEMPVSTLMCELDYPGQRPRQQSIPVAPEGTFSIEQVPAGHCTILLWVITDDPREAWWAIVEDVDIAPGQQTDLGIVVPIPPTG